MSHSGKQSRSGSDATTSSVKSNERENPIILSIKETPSVEPSVELDIDKAESDAIDKAIAKAYETSVELRYTKRSEIDDAELLNEPTLLTMGSNVVETNDGRLVDVRDLLSPKNREQYNKLMMSKGGKKSKKNKKKSKRKRTKGKKSRKH